MIPEFFTPILMHGREIRTSECLKMSGSSKNIFDLGIDVRIFFGYLLVALTRAS